MTVVDTQTVMRQLVLEVERSNIVVDSRKRGSLRATWSSIGHSTLRQR
jgi:hypothetical protein